MRRVSLLLSTASLLYPLAGSATTPVSTAALSELLVDNLRSAPATLVSDNSPALSAEISARIDHIAVQVGDRVRKGDVLVELDCRSYRSQLDASGARLAQLQAQLAFSRQQLKRAQDLKRKKSISDELVEQRQSELDSLLAQARAQQEQIRQAEIQVDRCAIPSPINGVVTERMASIGSLASPGTPLLKLVEIDRLEVSAQLRESEVDSLAAAKGYWFEYKGTRAAARLRQLLPVVDSRTRSREARFTLKPGDMPSGAAGRLIWQQGQPLIPAAYLVRRGDRLGVFYLSEGRAHFHPLPDAIEGQPADIDLDPGARIITEGRYGLAHGEEVRENNTPGNGS